MANTIPLLKRTVSLDQKSIDYLLEYGKTMGTNSLSAAIRMISHMAAYNETKRNIEEKGL